MGQRVTIRQVPLYTYRSFKPLGAQARINAAFGQGIGPVVLTYPVCTGAEYRLLDCPRSSTSSCAHHQDAGVECIAGGLQNKHRCLNTNNSNTQGVEREISA